MKLSTLKNKYWLLSISVFVLHQIHQIAFDRSLPFIDDYLDAFLSIPLLLGLVLQERQLAIDTLFPTFKDSNYQFSALEVALATVLLAVVFEEGLPRIRVDYTRDDWDYLAYGLGAIFFFLLINGKVKTQED